MQKNRYTLKLYQNAGVKYFYHNHPQNRMDKIDETKKLIEKPLNKNNNFMNEKEVENYQNKLEQNDLHQKSRQLADKANNLDELKIAIENNSLLAIQKTAINTVFADGNFNSDIMLIGEAPGANEDKQ